MTKTYEECGGLAFPMVLKNEASLGMTLRDYFAAQALVAVLTIESKESPSISRHEAASRSYDIADAMLQARHRS